MDPSSQNMDKSQGGVETPRNPYARGNSFDRPGTEPKVQTAETIKAMQPEQPAPGPVFSAPTTESTSVPQPAPAPLPSQHTVASGTGDIVLEPETPKKSKKPLIFAIIAIVLLVGAFVTYFVVTSGTGQQVAVQADAKTAFNRYANYLLYGEDSDEPLEGEYDEEEIYYVDEMNGSEDGLIFFDKLQQLFKDFYDNLPKTLGNNNDLKTLVDNYKDNLEIVKIDSEVEEPDSKEIYDKFMSSNTDKTKQNVNDRYVVYLNSSSEKAKKYGENMVEYWNLMIDLLQKAKNSGCVINNSMDEICFNKISSSEEIEKVENFSDNAGEILSSARQSIIENCWTLSKMLGGIDE